MGGPTRNPEGTRAASAIEIALRVGLWWLLGIWLGGFTLFPFLTVTAFRALPSADAGLVVGPILTLLHLYGGAAGIALAVIASRLGRSRWLVWLAAGLGGLCLYSHFGVSLEIAEVRDAAFGPEGTERGAARFNQLHQRSVGIFYVVTALAAVLAAGHAAADAVASRAVGRPKAREKP